MGIWFTSTYLGFFHGSLSNWFIISGIFRNNLTEIYNLRVIKVNIIIPALLDGLKTQVENDKFEKYDETLQTLKEHVRIKGYANDILEKSANRFLHLENKVAIEFLTYIVKISLYCVGGLIIVIGGFILIRAF